MPQNRAAAWLSQISMEDKYLIYLTFSAIHAINTELAQPSAGAGQHQRRSDEVQFFIGKTAVKMNDSAELLGAGGR